MRNTYLYENRMLTKKVKNNIICDGKGNDRVMSIKSLINAGVEDALEGRVVQDWKGIGLKD